MKAKDFKKLLEEESPLKIRCWHLCNKITLTWKQYQEVCKLAGKKG